MPTIAGITPISLIDDPGHLCQVIFLAGCIFACPYCHNTEIIHWPADRKSFCSDKQVFESLRNANRIIDSVCISGGEPLFHSDLPSFLKEIKALGFRIKLDTNGYFPDFLHKLIQAKLVDKVAMDIKNAPGCYAETCGLKTIDLSRIENSIHILTVSGVEHEFRSTLVREYHDQKRLSQYACWKLGRSELYLQNYRETFSLRNSHLHSFSLAEMKAFAAQLKEFFPNTTVRFA